MTGHDQTAVAPLRTGKPELSGNRDKSLLEVMDGLPTSEGIEFEPPPADIQLKAAEFD
ncbi:hypothetical protein [Variovorax rhizosphaerae]|uniref:Prevent-host-death protein n=1 Tax=Variovorax rhizosphaerae TaxID=1836200 RepID=A0ABU8WRQ8_9BURK